ncbi:uncharacterized protein BO80DRAFT_430158 [Aspergillus ibericus CBS 121593]|uniref:Uncharacterized protein n=1 Tax=Aspergillus ibericus CBS 121593 TaxID=1448316 RepID=A0A395GI33_9EURO|nr:hypothetical protein BO80DRAFT_430158 [Aspergillus ibericus CBS 121593]RAK95111.1 hypothetical protein BO80DRAFT_430158 [Aspergillus ibericus CBS 121593]
MPVNVGDGALASIRRGRTNGGRTPADGGFSYQTKSEEGTPYTSRWPPRIGRTTKRLNVTPGEDRD